MSCKSKLLNITRGIDYWEAFFNEEKINSDLFFKRHDITKEEAKELFKKYVCIVNLETSTVCNRKCDYCPLAIHDRNEQIHMDDEFYSKIISELGSIDYHSTVSLNLFNEPLLDAKIYSRIKELRQKCPKCFIKFNSNGDYLTREVLDKLVNAGLNAIFLTMHVPKGKTYTDEDRMNAIKMFFKKLELEFNVNEVVPNEKIVSDMNYRGMRLLVESHNWAVFGNDRGGAVESLSSESRVTPCVRPLREFTIAYDGSVYPCCQFYPDCEESQKYKVGQIDKNTGIFNIYSSKILTRWRKDLFVFGEKQKPCATCKDVDYSKNNNELRKNIIESSKINKIILLK